MKKFVLASNNQGKIKEFSELLQQADITITPQKEFNIVDIEETGLSFVENAILKARHASALSSLPAIADDSGLVVDALNGAPGIYSARYAGKGASTDANIKKLLLALENTPEEKRQAAFHCVLVLIEHANDPTPLICHCTWPGVILRHPRGGHGFGYDPIFFLPSQQKTAAELPSEIKNKISHRGQALQLLLKQLSEKT